jgi:hypothetical protein
VKFSDAFHIDVIDCYRLGIAANTGTNPNGTMLFSPNNCITYEQAVKMLARITEILEIKSSELTAANSDSNKTDPKAYYTREQAIVDMLNLADR